LLAVGLPNIGDSPSHSVQWWPRPGDDIKMAVHVALGYSGSQSILGESVPLSQKRKKCPHAHRDSSCPAGVNSRKVWSSRLQFFSIKSIKL
jgi:hypothetical protein